MQQTKYFVSKVLVVILFSTFCVRAPEEDFVVPKKKRISSSALKENIGQSMGHTLKNSANMLVFLGRMQQELMVKTTELIEQQSTSFFAKASGRQLQTYGQALENFDHVIEDCQHKFKEAFSRVQAAVE